MFTGLVEATGHVAKVVPKREGSRLTIVTPLADALGIGESVAVDGVCLTVAGRSPDAWEADVSPTTAEVTTLGQVRVGQRVNLERPLRLGDRLGGHLVSGHVDEVGWVRAREARTDALDVWFTVPAGGRLYLVERGSVAVAGVSLTIVSVDAEGFRVTLIPQTLTATTLGALEPGAPVNLEYDLVAKYLHRWALAGLGGERSTKGATA
jgi:riboflavin synthase